MSRHNFLSEYQSMVASSRLTKTATATLTDAEVMAWRYIDANHASVAIVLTFPTASAGNKGACPVIVNKGAAATTFVLSGKTVTLAQYQSCAVNSDGAQWNFDHVASIA